MATAGLCNSTYHPGSLDSSCGEDGGRNVDWAGLGRDSIENILA